MRLVGHFFSIVGLKFNANVLLVDSLINLYPNADRLQITAHSSCAFFHSLFIYIGDVDSSRHASHSLYAWLIRCMNYSIVSAYGYGHFPLSLKQFILMFRLDNRSVIGASSSTCICVSVCVQFFSCCCLCSARSRYTAVAVHAVSFS